MVGSCDLGICLHYSSSGYDLPMKVVDMFAARLPCLAIGGYPSVTELIKESGDSKNPSADGANGMLFKDSDELAKQII